MKFSSDKRCHTFKIQRTKESVLEKFLYQVCPALKNEKEKIVMKIVEIIEARGHQNIQSTHRTTIAVTKNSNLTKNGDCFIAVNATKCAEDLDSRFKNAVRKDGALITIMIEADDKKEVVRALGSPNLSFTNTFDFVVRKSNFMCGRTIAIRADKAANDLSRKLVEKLQNPNQKVKMKLIAEYY